MYQSLYRRYRPRRFSEILGQPHVVAALLNAVRTDRVSHAYLFSGPRGTGKTSTARILAKALNCLTPDDGEPCGVCTSCVAVDSGSSFDVHEHDAASNRGINEIRAILDSVHLATPGRTKVYILDEVHMLTKEAEAALLKTLEEPPSNVVFVLATTDPQKVNETITSRTQALKFQLLAADVLAAHVRHVVGDAGLEVDDASISAVLRQGGGSARDTLSALEQAAAAGGLVDDSSAVDAIVDALSQGDTGRVLAAVAEAVQSGRDPRTLTERLVGQLRDLFLVLMAPELVQLPSDAVARLTERARSLGAASAVRAVEVLGATLVDIRNAPDPRLLLDVALVRLTRPELDASPAALVERLDRLERSIAAGAAPADASRPAPAATPAASAAPAPATGRARLGAAAGPIPARAPAATPAPGAAATAEPVAEPVAAPAPAAGGRPLAEVWAERVLPSLQPKARAVLRSATARQHDADTLTLSVPNAAHRDRCQEFVGEIEAALSRASSRSVAVRLAVGGGGGEGDFAGDEGPSGSEPPRASPPETVVAYDTMVDDLPDDVLDAPIEELREAPVVDIAQAGLERLMRAFPGSEVIEATG
jgi:DNA polymerase III subunit gamma/tau